MKKFLHTYSPMKMEQTECSETLTYKIQTPGSYPEESIQHVDTKFYILLTVHLEAILDDNHLGAVFLNVFISCLYMFGATSAHHQEDQILLIHHLV